MKNIENKLKPEPMSDKEVNDLFDGWGLIAMLSPFAIAVGGRLRGGVVIANKAEVIEFDGKRSKMGLKRVYNNIVYALAHSPYKRKGLIMAPKASLDRKGNSVWISTKDETYLFDLSGRANRTEFYKSTYALYTKRCGEK